MLGSPWKLKVEGSTLPMVADAAEVRRALELFADPDGYCQLVAIYKELEGQTRTAARAAKSTDLDGLCAAVHDLPTGMGIYFEINPVNPGLSRKATAKDIARRRWLFIDIDSEKAEGFQSESATNQEKNGAALQCDAIVAHLSDMGWPAPVVTDSGNGFGLFYRIDLPNDPLSQQIVRGVLYGLVDRFSCVDTATHNADRLAKLPGTWARKGNNTDDRPHRPCRLVSAPENPQVVPIDLLQRIAPRPKPVEVKRRSPIKPTNGIGSTNYGKAALNKIVDEVASAPEGTRNNTLYKKTARVANLVAGGEIDKHEAIAALKDAGLAAEPDRANATDTVERAFEEGLKQPEAAPEKNGLGPKAILGRKKLVAKVDEGKDSLTVSMEDVRPQAVKWLVRGRIPIGFITIFAGRSAVGKSVVALDIIARLTVGGEIPGGNGECFEEGGALIISEDSHEYVLAPRLIAAGADRRRVRAMKWETMGLYHLGDVEMLDRAANEVPGGVSLVVIDPPTNFLGDVDEHKNAEVRQVLMKIVEWCGKKGVAVVLITHVNKQSSKDVEAISRVMGTVAWVTTSRISHTFCSDPDDETKKLWMPAKTNLAEMPKGLAYRIESVDGQPKIEWLGEVEMTADDAMNAAPKARKRAVVATEWLRDKFKEQKEWRSSDLFEAARQAGISKNAIFEAKDILALPKAKQEVAENGDKAWIWWVPDAWGEGVSGERA